MKYKFSLLLVIMLALFSTSCTLAPAKWELIDEGILTSVTEIQGKTAITFDAERIILLSDYSQDFPVPIIPGKYYFLYKEPGTRVWNGYHLRADKVDGM